MTSFVVLQHGDESSAKHGEKTLFVRDAFSVLALAFPVLWLFWHRLWLLGMAAFCIMGLVAILLSQSAAPWAASFVSLLLSMYVALEGPALRIKFAQLSGYKLLGVVEAEKLDEAELKWLMQNRTFTNSQKTIRPAAAAPIGDLIFEGHH